MGLIFGALPSWANNFHGDGYGYGYGCGYGYGDGYGDGSGYGSGSGYGYGYGSGSGDDSGYGYGYGSGSGDDSGSGSGYGYGYGSGYGSGYWRLIAARFAAKWEQAQGLIAFWKSTADGNSANGGKMPQPASEGMVHAIKGPLKLCGPGALHATLIPDKWSGDRLWIVALKGEVQFGDDKMGALEREILCEVKE